MRLRKFVVTTVNCPMLSFWSVLSNFQYIAHSTTKMNPVFEPKIISVIPSAALHIWSRSLVIRAQWYSTART
jgi:hypothetical protein